MRSELKKQLEREELERLIKKASVQAADVKTSLETLLEKENEYIKFLERENKYLGREHRYMTVALAVLSSTTILLLLNLAF